MAKVSVIIPAYNEEKYIKRCLDSAINQDLDDIEVIAINDGSTDNTLSIMREYEKKNVKIVDQNNHGAGYARNMGLLGAQGEYIQFLDADDYLQPGALKKLYTLGKKYDADIVKMGVQTRVGPIKLGDYTYIGKLEDGIVDKSNNPNYMVECLSTIWDKFTKHDLLEGVKFPLYPSWQDLAVTPYLLAKADTIYHTNDKLYNYQMMFNTTVRNTFKMNKRLTILLLTTLLCLDIQAQRVNLNDWTMLTDGSQYEWVTDKYQWGKLYYNADGDISVKTDRQLDGDDIVETYILTNTSKRNVRLKDIGIYTPFNDNYPDAKTCMTSRCNVHVWPGGKAAYVNAMRMSGKGPHLGLMITEGEITDYDIWERGSNKGMSNFRGVLALCPPDMTLKPGQSYRLTWRLFVHNGTDFDEQLLKRGGMIVRSNKYVYAVGETAKVDFITKTKTITKTIKITKTGDNRVEYKGTHALLLGISGEQELIDKRIRFILDHQQMNNPDDPRYGAFMVYDNEGDTIVTNYTRSDLDEGRERVGMGILLAAYALNEELRIKNEELIFALERYAKFVREKMQQKDYTTGSSVVRKSKNRGYNYAWVADFYFRMSLLAAANSQLSTLNSKLARQYALDGYATLQALYRQFGYGFYCIDYPVITGLKALEQAGLTFEREQLLYDFQATADILVKNGLDFPKFEVNYEQSIIAPAVQFLCEVYLATNNKRYLNAAKNMLPALEALQWHQPSYRMNEIGIRHWDGYWFGKRQTYGDVISSINAAIRWKWMTSVPVSPRSMFSRMLISILSSLI